MNTKKSRLKALEHKAGPAEVDRIQVIWTCYGQPEPEELILARQRGDKIIQLKWDDNDFEEEDQAE